jgi:single-strand DNA-binding protein
MPQFQQVTIIGHLGRDPETRYSPNGDAITGFTVAVSEKWGKGDEKKEHTEWFRVQSFKTLAEIAGKYLKKGNPVFLQGRLRTRKWKDKEGAERFSTELIADKIQLLGKQETAGSAPEKKPGHFDDMPDDIPF